MEGQFDNIAVRGIKVVVPEKHIDNMLYADVLGARRCKKQIKLTGVKSRYVSKRKQTAADLAYGAGKALIDELGWDAKDISVLIFATQNPLFTLPSTAFFLQKRLGISKDAVVFDINLGCSGIVVGMQVVSSILQHQKKIGKGLLLFSDIVYDPDNKICNTPDGLAHNMLFGSAGSAMAIECGKKSNPIYFETHSDGERYKAIMRRSKYDFSMDGEAVFSFGVNDVANDMIAFRKKFNLIEDAIDYYSFHQAQALMLTTIDSVCDIPVEKELRSLEEYGNTSGSAVLVNLCANKDLFVDKENLRVIMCGFGVGLSWSYLYLNIPTKCIFPISVYDECYGRE